MLKNYLKILFNAIYDILVLIEYKKYVLQAKVSVKTKANKKIKFREINKSVNNLFIARY